MKERLQTLLNNSYTPMDYLCYSAVAVMKDGKTFEGVNLKNTIFRDNIYAEQIAIAQAVAHGYKYGDFEELYIMVGSNKFKDMNYVATDVIEEFFEPDKKIICATVKGETILTLVKDIRGYKPSIREEA